MMWYRYIMWGALAAFAIIGIIGIIITAVKKSKKKDQDIAQCVLIRAFSLLFAISLGAFAVTDFIRDLDEKISNPQVSVECSVCHEEINTPYCGYCGEKVG